MKKQEEARLEEARLEQVPWRKWGPYLSEREWGTVREDYSENGQAWGYFSHDQARSRAYRWGEDGIAGISDDKQQLCFAIALWNGVDPILKERLFGLTGDEGNHGEDVKEYYFYLDNTPTHSYMKYLYKYPQKPYPYEDLLQENKRRSREEPEYELLDTGIFEEDRYFDVFIEYAKESEEDYCIQVHVVNRGSKAATMHLLPNLWFRNTWSWKELKVKPSLKLVGDSIQASHFYLGEYWLYCDKPKEFLFTENETNLEKVFGKTNTSPYVKDAFHNYVIQDKKESVNPACIGTKAAPYYVVTVPATETVTVKLRLTSKKGLTDPFGMEFKEVFTSRKQEADEFYHKITPYSISDDMRNVQRQAFAGLLWNKQFYHYNVHKWLFGDPSPPPPAEKRRKGRNREWRTFDAADVFSMPDKWEYPWFASWDLAYHAIAFALIDPDFAKKQMLLLTKEWYMHPNGQLPAYEWSFSDVNPPVHALATMRIYQIEAKYTGRKDRAFLEQMFHKLSLNFTWWINRKDAEGRNLFEGGFLGLDNIGAFDRTSGPPGGGQLYQVDGTAWMAMYALNLLQIALELSVEDHVYEHMATKYFEHFISIAEAMNNISGKLEGLWDEQAGFYHGILMMPNEDHIQLNMDTIIGIIPLFAVAVSDERIDYVFPGYEKRYQWYLKHHPELLNSVVDINPSDTKSMLLSLVNKDKLRRILEKILDSDQFLSPYGVRSVSKRLEKDPFSIELAGGKYTLNYEPAESTTFLFGGNSNWRGPVWVPLNYLLTQALDKFYYFWGPDFKVECPTGSGKFLSLRDVSSELSLRMIKIFLKDEQGKRPVYGNIKKFQTDPHWKDYILFHEYFHGDNGAGLGASSQTGWTGLIAKMIHEYGEYVLAKEVPEELKNKQT